MKLKVLILVGLQGSGKTTFAKELLEKEPGKWKRTNKDEIRLLLDNGKWSGKNEKFVVEIRNNIILSALNKGFNVVVDDTNLNKVHIENIKELVKNLALVEIKYFTAISLEECITRDSKRANPVGKGVILKTWSQYLKPKPVEYIEGLPDACIFDLDGTLCLFGNKNPYERDFENDKLNVPVYHVLDGMKNKGYKIIFVSGRKDIYKNVTEEWLNQWIGKYDYLYMRKTAPEGTQEPKDTVVKREIYEKYIKDKFNVLFVADDRKVCKRLWVSLGLFVLDCNQYDLDF